MAAERWGQFVSLCDEFKSFDLVLSRVVVGRNAACTGVWVHPVFVMHVLYLTCCCMSTGCLSATRKSNHLR